MTRRRVGQALIVITVFGALCFAAWQWASRFYERRTRDALKKFGVFADLDYDSVDLSLLPPATRVHGLTIRPLAPPGLTVTIPEVVVRKVQSGSSIPSELDVELRGVTLDFKVPPLQATSPIAIVFDETPRADLSLAYKYDPGSKEFVLHRLALATRDHGAIDLSAVVSGVSAVDPPGRTALSREMTERSIAEALSEAALVRAELRYSDRGLLARLALLLAISKGESAADAAAEMLTLSDGPLDRLPPSEMNEGRALKNFLLKPGTLALRSEPKIPIPIARFALASVATFPPLHLKVEATPGAPFQDQVRDLAKDRVDKLADAAKQARLLGAWSDARDYANAANTLLPDDPVAQAILASVTPATGPTPSPVGGTSLIGPSPAPVPAANPAVPVGPSRVAPRNQWAARDYGPCADWTTAPTACPNGFVRFYLTILSRNDPAICLAAWEDPSAAVYRLCSRLPSEPHDIRVGSIRVVSQGSNSATLHVDFVDDGVPWRVVAVTVKRGGGDWRIAGWRRRR